MKSVDTLIRLRKHELDVERRALGALEVKSQELDARREALDAEYVAETEHARGDVEASYAIGGYITSTRQRRQMIEQEKAALSQEIALAEARVRDAFRELKRFELAAAQSATARTRRRSVSNRTSSTRLR